MAFWAGKSSSMGSVENWASWLTMLTRYLTRWILITMDALTTWSSLRLRFKKTSRSSKSTSRRHSQCLTKTKTTTSQLRNWRVSYALVNRMPFVHHKATTNQWRLQLLQTTREPWVRSLFKMTHSSSKWWWRRMRIATAKFPLANSSRK